MTRPTASLSDWDSEKAWCPHSWPITCKGSWLVGWGGCVGGWVGWCEGWGAVSWGRG